MSDRIQAVDLFCGGGGFSTGLALACEDLGHDVDLVAVNHWTTAIETHERNHAWAEHRNAKVEELHPPDVVDPGEVDLLVASPECTHFSVARGGKPVSEQKRASPWHVIDWAQKVRPDAVLLENVKELRSWGPVDEDGQPSRNGELFEAWINSLHALGYSVEYRVLNAADFGDATSRERLFVVGRLEERATFPEPTHSEDGDDLPSWRSAAEILDWEDRGKSLWERSQPLVENTMARIAEGLRRHCHDDVAAFADVVGELGKADVEAMQEDVVPAADAHEAAEDRESPFLVRGPTAAADGGQESAFVLGQHSGSVARDVEERALPTIATRGAIQLYAPEAFVLPRNGAHGDLHSNATFTPESRPLQTVTASNHDGHLVSPFLVEYYGNGRAQSVEDPLPTVTTRDRFALVVPELYPFGLDVRFRMLKPSELAAAQGFPSDYDFAGSTKKDVTEQIGNAVPVNLARALCRHLLTDGEPALSTFGGGVTAEMEADD
ncbi:DNA cytosine methyltransferase [Halarchaeum salinum]|uniref:DNA (cytosine-5-)-methyltransferase n=1 Tax=Halarchaeum salinum TaxID=489912 RepID=A0AAV3S8D4_9EURY